MYVVNNVLNIYIYFLIVSVQFLDVAPELGNSYTEVIAPQDVATYGGLCALASFERTELKVFHLLYFSDI